MTWEIPIPYQDEGDQILEVIDAARETLTAMSSGWWSRSPTTR
jgi:hypothetical protein